MSTQERDYVLGTHDEEIARLGLQHRIWRPHVTAAWHRAGFTVGQTLLDVGCGPGFASLDLAELVGPRGKVVAVDRSRRFLDVLESERDRRGLGHLEVHEQDLEQGELPVRGADGAWTRWVFAFVRNPRELVARVHRALRPGGTFVVFEYFHYETWRFAPRSPVFEEFVQKVIESWRASGGEPDVGMDLPHWLGELGFEVKETRPITEVVSAREFFWQWPRAFVESGGRRLADLGFLTPERVRELLEDFDRREADPNTRIVTPGVLAITAVKQ
jgi:SAM-dependent methyltransferase